MSCPPKLTDLVNALDDLPAAKVRYLCALLGVTQCTLDEIDANHREDALTRAQKYLQAWLDRDENTTWTSILDALRRSKKLNKGGLADKIQRRHCSTAKPLATSSQSSKVSSSQSSSEVDISTSASSHVSSIEYKPHPDPPQLPTSPPSKPNDKRIASDMFHLKKDFNSVVVNAQVDLSMKEMPLREFYHFKVSLTKLPMLTLGKKSRFLRTKEKRKILKAKSVDAVFEVIDPYWNYVDYSLLEHVVEKYCSEDVKMEMRGYKDRLHAFEKATSVKHFTSNISDDRALPSGYSTLTATLGVDAEECTLYQVRERLEEIARRACLQPYVAMMHSLHASRVVLTIAFPRAVRKTIKRSLNKTFLQELAIVPNSLHFTKKPATQASKLEKLHIPGIPHSYIADSAVMPDPPQNVREEVSI